MNEIAIQPIDGQVVLQEIDAEVRENVQSAEAEATRRAYESDWSHFMGWCKGAGYSSLPASPETVARYISGMSKEGFAPSTINRRLATISVMHQRSDHPTPTAHVLVRTTLKGIRVRRTTKKQKKEPIRATHLLNLVSVLPEGPKGLRDKAMILLGFAGGFRRSEIVALNVEDITFVKEGMRVEILRSKTDQEGKGRSIGICRGSHRFLCPVEAMQEWLTTVRIEAGPVFRPINRHGHVAEDRLSDRAVAEVVKEIAEKLGLDPKKVGGHSLRAGFVTDCLQKGLPTPIIKNFTGHRSDGTLAEYFREADLFSRNVTTTLGL